MRLWDSATGVPISTLEGHSDPVMYLSFSRSGSELASQSKDKTVRLWDGVTGAPIGALDGDSKIYSSLFLSPVSPLASMSVGIHWEGDTDGSFDTDADWFLSSEVLSMSLCRSSRYPSRGYFIQPTIITTSPVPLLWLPADTAYISGTVFSGKAVAFGCENGQVIILDLSQLNLQETIIT